MSIKKLSEVDICQGVNTRDNEKDLLSWIDELFSDRDTRIRVERAIARKIGILSHGLIKWSDSVSKKCVADTFNLVVLELEKEGLFQENLSKI